MTEEAYIPDFVVTQHPNGFVEARLRGNEKIEQIADDIWQLEEILHERFPRGFTIELTKSSRT